MMLCPDRFSENLSEFEKRKDYLAEIDIIYVHFIPLLKTGEGNNHGGYVVADYFMVDDKSGTMNQLEKVMRLLKRRNA